MNIAKLLTIMLSLLFISACSSFNANYKAKQLHDKGDYFASTITLIDYLKKNADDVPSKDMVNLINSNILKIQNQLNNTATTDYDTKIKHYLDLRAITLAVENANLTHKPVNLTVTPLSLTDINLAELYYLKGNAISPTRNEDYLAKAQLYQQGLQYYKYKDMQKLMEQNQFTYYSNLAEENYQMALLDIQIKNYQRACEYLEKTIDNYQNYGDYKDSKQLFAKYDPIWRKEKASQLYNQATALTNKANSTADYKNIRDYYEQAYLVYSRYGKFKDSEALADKYDHLWCQSLANDYYNQADSYRRQQTKKGFRTAAKYYQQAFDSYSRYGSFKDSVSLAKQMVEQGIINIDYYSTHYSDADNTVSRAIESVFADSEFNINSSTNDFTIKADLAMDTKEFDKIISERDIVKDLYAYKEIKRLTKRVYTITGTIRIDGKLYDYQSFDIENVSSLTHTYYEGTYPKNLSESYEQENTGYWREIKSEYALKEDALAELKDQLIRYFNRVRQQALNQL